LQKYLHTYSKDSNLKCQSSKKQLTVVSRDNYEKLLYHKKLKSWKCLNRSHNLEEILIRNGY